MVVNYRVFIKGFNTDAGVYAAHASDVLQCEGEGGKGYYPILP